MGALARFISFCARSSRARDKAGFRVFHGPAAGRIFEAGRDIRIGIRVCVISIDMEGETGMIPRQPPEIAHALGMCGGFKVEPVRPLSAFAGAASWHVSSFAF